MSPSESAVDLVTEPAGRTLALSRVGLTTLALAASGSTALVFNVLLARRLSVSGFGEIARTYSFALGVAQITMAAVAPALAWRVGNEPTQTDRQMLARASLPVLLGATALVSLLFPVAVVLGVVPSRGTYIAGGWLFAVVYPTYFGLKMLLFALDGARLYAVLEFGSDITFALALSAFVVLEPSGALIAFSIAYGAFVLVAIRLVKKRAGPASRRFALDRSLVRYAALGGAATYSSIVRFPLAVAVAGVVAGSIAAGRVGAVVALAMPFFLVPQAMGILTFAGVARRDEAASLLVRRGVRGVSLFSGALVPVAIVLAPVVIPRLLGNRYSETVGSFVVLLACLVPQLIATPVGNALAGEGAVGLSATISLAGLATALAGVAVGAAYGGSAGAVAGLGFSTAFTGGWLLLVGRRRYALRVPDVMFSITVPVALVVESAHPSLLLTIGSAVAFAAAPLMLNVVPVHVARARTNATIWAQVSSWTEPRRQAARMGVSLPTAVGLSIACGVALAITPRLALGLVVVSLIGVAAFMRPAESVLCLLVVKPVVDYWVRLTLGPSSAGQVWGAAILACSVVYLIRVGRAPGNWHAPVILLAVYPLLAISRDHGTQSVINEVRLATWLAVVMVIERYASDARRQEAVLRTGLAAAALLVGIIGIAVHQNHYGSAYYASTSAFSQLSVQQPSGLAASAVFCAALVLLPILAGRRALLWLSMLGLLTAAIVISLVRASFAGLAILLTVFLARGIYNRRVSLIAAAFGAVAAVGIAVVLYANVISARLQKAAPRLSYWRPVLRGTLEHANSIIIGHGPSFSYDVIQQAVGLRIWSHNDFIDLFATGGVLLLAAFLMVVVWLLKSAWTLARSRAQSSNAREVGILGLCACGAWVVISSLDGAVFASSAFFFAILLGLIRAMNATPQHTWIDVGDEVALDHAHMAPVRLVSESA